MRKLCHFFLIALLAVALPVSLALAEEERQPLLVKGMQKQDFFRVFFYCKPPISFAPDIKRNILTIRFDRSFTPDISGLYPYFGQAITQAYWSKDGTQAILKLSSDNYTFRKFEGENFVGIDLVQKPQTAKTSPTEPEATAPIDLASAQPKLVKKFEQTAVEAEQTQESAPLEAATKIEKSPAAETKPSAAPQVPPSAVEKEATVSPAPAKPAEEPETTNTQETPLPTSTQEQGETSDTTSEEPSSTTDTPPATGEKPQQEEAVNDSSLQTIAREEESLNIDEEDQQTAIETMLLDGFAEAAVGDAPETTKPPIATTNTVATDTPQTTETVVSFKDIETQMNMVFPWNEPVGAAVFTRGNFLWVIFDRHQKVDVDKIVTANKATLNNGEQMDNKYYTILRFAMLVPFNALAYRRDNNWVVGLTEKKVMPMEEPTIDMDVSELHGSKLLIRSQEIVKPLRLIDPNVGDELIVLPYQQEDLGFQRPHSFIDFIFTKTAQGAAIELISDGIMLDVVKKGVEIAGPTNKLAGSAQASLRELQEQERQAKLRAERLKGKSGDITLIKFNTWKVGDEKSYKDDLEKLQWDVVEANWSEKSKPRLELARFYFAHQLYNEALGVIDIIKAFDEPFSASNDVKVLEAAAYFRSGSFNEALDAFNLVNVKALEERARTEFLFWKAATSLELDNQIKIDKFIATNPVEDKKGEQNEAEDEVANTKLMYDTSSRLLKIIRKMDPDFVNADELQKLESTARFVTNHYQESIRRFEESDLYRSGDAFQAEENRLWWSTTERRKAEDDTLEFLKGIDVFLKYYPPNVYNDFALLALEDRLKKNDLVVAEEILSTFKPEERLQQKNSITFLHGLFYAKDEEPAKAIETWKKLKDEVFDPYNRARSQFAMTVFQLRQQEIDVKQAITNLSNLRSLWRGDVLEFHILKMLGEFYMDEKEYMEGFKVWRSAIAAFPGSDEALLIAKKMSDKFVQIFSQGEADTIPKLDALTLFYEFRELTPIGKLGDEMISRLADRLIEVDLLDRAAALLTHQVRFRLIGEERNVAAMKLVRVHLMNHDPQAAYDVLNATYNDTMSDELKEERKYLLARSLMELGKSNKVLALLKTDDSYKASFLRADVFWNNKVWRKVVEELETPFREIRREEKTLNSDEMDQLLRLAVAYALTDQKKRLQVLYEDFINFIPFEDRKKVFTFVATDRGPVDFRNLEQTVEFSDMNDFLVRYMQTSNSMTAEEDMPPATDTPAAEATPGSKGGGI